MSMRMNESICIFHRMQHLGHLRLHDCGPDSSCEALLHYGPRNESQLQELEFFLTRASKCFSNSIRIFTGSRLYQIHKKNEWKWEKTQKILINILERKEENSDWKLCPECFEILPKRYFFAMKTSPDGLQSTCRPCKNLDKKKRKGDTQKRKFELRYASDSDFTEPEEEEKKEEKSKSEQNHTVNLMEEVTSETLRNSIIELLKQEDDHDQELILMEDRILKKFQIDPNDQDPKLMKTKLCLFFENVGWKTKKMETLQIGMKLLDLFQKDVQLGKSQRREK